MRINVQDPRHQFWLKKLRVFVNGQDVTNRCYEFDAEKGYALCYKRGEKGFYIENGDVAREAFYGKVVVRPRAFMEKGGNN